MTHILTVAMDLNARLKEIPGLDLVRELSDLIVTENAIHVTILADPQRSIAGFRRLSLADRVLQRQPHVDLHLVARR
jgi:K+-sensing histidine kinase KdpD